MGILGRNGPLFKGDVMPGQETSGRTRLRVCPPPPAGFDPFAASKVDLARHGLPLRPDAQTQPDLAALWDRLADRYRDFEHLESRPSTGTAGTKAAQRALAPRLLPLDPQESCGYSLSGSQAAPFTALFATWTVPDLRYSNDPYGPDYFRTFVSLGFLDLHTEMSVDSAQHITCGLWAEGVGTINLPVGPGDVVSGSLCLDTKPPGTAHYFLANQTTGQTINFTLDTGFPPAVTIAAGVSRGWDHPNPALARFGVVYFDEISAYSTNGHQPFPAGSQAVTMVDQNGTTLAQPDMLTDYTFKTIFVTA
jgi:Peptidase A4 family